MGLNGPQVIEQEAGIREYDSKNKPFIWQMTGGEVRAECGFADKFVRDDAETVRKAVIECSEKGVPKEFRTEKYEYFLEKLEKFDTSKQVDENSAKELFARGGSHD